MLDCSMPLPYIASILNSRVSMTWNGDLKKPSGQFLLGALNALKTTRDQPVWA